MTFYKYLILLFFIVTSTYANYGYEKEIDYLINEISKSNCTFERNKKTYKSKKVTSHILYKKEYFKDKINTTEEFIKYSATKSEISGKKYKIKCLDEKEEYLKNWLLKKLKKYRKDKQ